MKSIPNLDDALAAYEAGAQTFRAMRPATAGKAAAFTAAAGAALALAPSADAAIQYSGPQNILIPIPTTTSTTFANYVLDIDGDGFNDFSFDMGRYLIEGDFIHFMNVVASTNGIGVQSNGGLPARLIAGSPINSTQTGQNGMRTVAFTASGAFLASSGNWPGGSMNQAAAGFLGVKFRHNTGSGTTDHFAWIRVGISNQTDLADAPVALTIYDWAWEDTANTPINAGATGAIPEPGPTAGLALLAAGAAGIGAWRRRKQAAQPAS